MKTKRELFGVPENVADAYETALADVRREMVRLSAGERERETAEYRRGYRAAMIALSKAIRLEDR